RAYPNPPSVFEENGRRMDQHKCKVRTFQAQIVSYPVIKAQVLEVEVITALQLSEYMISCYSLL
ncbi:hypothetical protein, partial [Cohnella lubricantis]|uniref:hypothetical protein n=1 Tax=Cohnella lubricantis TaxID=2163172 RepID=UPI0039EF3B20